MKSKSDRLPKFKPMPVSGPPVQTNPRVWNPAVHGLPYWFKPFAADLVIKPFYTPHAIAEAAHQGAVLPQTLCFAAFKITELRSRENPWHPSGRLDRLVIEGQGLSLTLKFNGEGEQIEVISVSKLYATQPALSPTYMNAKYKGPRMPGDTKSAISGKVRRP